MQLFLYEYTCAAALAGAPTASLRAEGWAMLAAVLEDFGRLSEIEVITLAHEPLALAAGQRCRVVRADPEEQIFRELAAASNFTLVIAPELDHILLTRCTWVEESGGRLLGPSAASVRLTGDKWALGQHLRQQQIATPECRLCPANPEEIELPYPLVWKPRYGAGSVATFIVRDAADWPRCRQEAHGEGWEGESLAQTWVAGQPASVALLVGPQQCVPLPPAAQDLSTDGRFHYRGGSLPLPPALADRASRLARQVVAVVPGLAGYVGVDVILGDAADGSRDWVIEINPRLTTSYVGLRALCRDNLAEAMLRVIQGFETPALSWKPGPVRFTSEGRIASLV